EQSGLAVGNAFKLLGGHSLGAAGEGAEPRIDVSGTGANTESRRRGEAHARVHALPVTDGGEARAAAEMCEDHAAARRAGAGRARELLHEERIREAVESVTLHALRLEPPRNGEQLRDPRHAMMERRVE